MIDICSNIALSRIVSRVARCLCKTAQYEKHMVFISNYSMRTIVVFPYSSSPLPFYPFINYKHPALRLLQNSKSHPRLSFFLKHWKKKLVQEIFITFGINFVIKKSRATRATRAPPWSRRAAAAARRGFLCFALHPQPTASGYAPAAPPLSVARSVARSPPVGGNRAEAKEARRRNAYVFFDDDR